MSIIAHYVVSGPRDKFLAEYGVEVTGPGWYLTDTDTILITPSEYSSPIDAWKTAGDLFIGHVWNAPFHSLLISTLALAPTRSDSRTLFQGASK